jgi:hypothetical protein
MAEARSNKEEDDEVEKPVVIRTFRRQSSVEMRMYPQQDVGTDSEEEKSDDDEDEKSAEDEDYDGYVNRVNHVCGTVQKAIKLKFTKSHTIFC